MEKLIDDILNGTFYDDLGIKELNYLDYYFPCCSPCDELQQYDQIHKYNIFLDDA